MAKKRSIKQIVAIFIFAALILFLFSKEVRAEEKEAGTAGQLASLTIETNSNNTKEVDPRILRLKAYFAKYHSPFVEYADTFVHQADRNGLDWKLVAAIAGVESTFGHFIPTNSYNAWGWAVFTGRSYGAAFKDWNDGIATVSQGLRQNYVEKGLTSPTAMGTIYAASPAWSGHVEHFMTEIDTFHIPDDKPHAIAINL
jgi:hypothetical protein